MSEPSVKLEQQPAVRRPGRRLVLLALAAVLCLAAGLGAFSAYREYRVWRHAREAQRALDRGDLEAARASLTACLEARPENAGYHFLAGRTARRLGLYDEAEQHLRRCLQLGGRRDDVNLELRLLRAQQGDESEEEDRELLALADGGHPDAVLILEALTQGSLQSSRRVQWAETCLNKWLERDPKCVKALVWRGEIQDRLRRRENALSDYTTAVSLDEGNFDARDHLAWALVRSQMSDRALAQFEHLHRLRPHDAHVQLGLALSLRGMGRRDEAGRLLDALLAEHPDDQDALRERGRLAFSGGRPEQAEPFLRRAVRLDSGDEEANYLLAQCLDQIDRKTRVVFAPTAPCLHLYRWVRRLEARGYRIVYDGLRADATRFETLYLQLLASPARRPEPYFEMGNLLVRANRPDDAREWFEQALRVDPRHEPSRDALRRLQGSRKRGQSP